MKKIKILVWSLVSLALSFVIRRDDKKIVFGSWFGEMYIDNSKYLAEYAISHYLKQGYTCYWVGKKVIRNRIDPRLHFIELNSITSIIPLLRCKFFFFSQIHTTDICEFNVYRNAILCFLDHGNTIKKCGADDPDYHGQFDVEKFNLVKKTYVKLTGKIISYDYITVSSEENIDTYISAYKHLVSNTTKYIKSGLPRNELLFECDQKKREELKLKYANLLGFDKEKSIIMYLPTFRRKAEKVYSFTDLPKEQMKQLIDFLKRHNAILLEKNHYVANKYDCNHAESAEYIIKINVPVDLQEMLCFTDVQICDYSGCYLDYLILNRPLIHFLYDYEEYRDHDSGLYYDVKDFAAGKVVQTVDGVIEELRKIYTKTDNYIADRKRVRDRFLEFEHGNASEIILKEILG